MVIMILSAVAILSMPVLSRCKESARRAHCASNLSQIGKAAMMHADVMT